MIPSRFAAAAAVLVEEIAGVAAAVKIAVAFVVVSSRKVTGLVAVAVTVQFVAELELAEFLVAFVVAVVEAGVETEPVVQQWGMKLTPLH